LNSVDRFSKNTQRSNFIKISPVGAELFRADRPTDTTKLAVAFRNFANVQIMIDDPSTCHAPDSVPSNSQPHSIFLILIFNIMLASPRFYKWTPQSSANFSQKNHVHCPVSSSQLIWCSVSWQVI